MNLKWAVLHLIAFSSGSIFCFADKHEDGICNNSTIIPTCCTNFIYNDALKQCTACVGRFGVNCNNSCPEGHYGIACSNKCACDDNLCNKVLGCQINATGIDLKRRYFRMILHLGLSLSALIIIVLVGVLLRLAYRLKRGARTRCERANVGNMMMTDSSAVYAPAVCPNRTPIQGVQQNDQMYGN